MPLIAANVDRKEILHGSAYLLTEWPLEQRVTLAPHDDKEERQVSPSPRPVAVQIQPQTHFVAVFAGVKRCQAERQEGKIRTKSRFMWSVVEFH